MGIRCDDDGTLEAVRSAYAARSVEDPRATDDFSICTAPPLVPGSPRSLPYLARGRARVAHARSVTRLLMRLDLELGELEPDPDVLLPKVEGSAALVLGSSAAFIPVELAQRVRAIERIIGDRDIRLADASAVRLDLRTLEVVVVPGLSRNRQFVDGDRLLALPGRYEPKALFALAGELSESDGRSVTMLRLIDRVRDRCGLTPAGYLEQLDRLTQRIAVSSTDLTPSALDEVVASLR